MKTIYQLVKGTQGLLSVFLFFLNGGAFQHHPKSSRLPECYQLTCFSNIGNPYYLTFVYRGWNPIKYIAALMRQPIQPHVVSLIWDRSHCEIGGLAASFRRACPPLLKQTRGFCESGVDRVDIIYTLGCPLSQDAIVANEG